jgi:drug/metabolite transporter (DMT)-like permease
VTAGSTDLGLGLALLSTTAYNSGLIVEKQALLQMPTLSGWHVFSVVLRLLSAPRWLMGFALMLCGLGFQVLALTLAPVTLVQPLIAGGVGVVLLLSRLVLREHLDRVQYACVAVMALSVVLLALSAGGGSAKVGSQVSGLLLAVIALPSCLVAIMAGASALRAGSRKHRVPVIGVSYGLATGLLYGVAALAIKALSGALLHSHGVGGTLIAVVSSPYLYVMAGCSALGLLMFQTALQRCRIAIVAPVSNVLGSIYFMVIGTWIFHERLPSDPARLVLRLGGILIACFVVAQLSRRSGPARPPAPRPRPAAPPWHPAAPLPRPVAPSPRLWRNEGEAHGPG